MAHRLEIYIECGLIAVAIIVFIYLFMKRGMSRKK